MTLKRKITKEEFTALSETMKGEYKEQNGSYIIDLEGDDDAITDLRAALEKERKEKTNTKAERDAKAATVAELELKITQAEELVEASKNGTQDEVRKLQTKHADAITALKATHTEETGKLKGHLEKAFASQPADSFASKYASTPAFAKMLAREYGSRFKLDYDADGNPQTVIMDAQGQPIDEKKLATEVYANADIAAMLRPISGSGGGAGANLGGGGGGQGLTLTQQHQQEAARLGLRN